MIYLSIFCAVSAVVNIALGIKNNNQTNLYAGAAATAAALAFYAFS